MCHHGQVAVVPLKHDHLVLSRPLKLPEKTYFLLEKLLFKTAPDSLSAFLSEIWSLCFFSFWATLWAEAKVSLQLAVSFTLAAQDQFQHLPLISFFLFFTTLLVSPPIKVPKTCRFSSCQSVSPAHLSPEAPTTWRHLAKRSSNV